MKALLVRVGADLSEGGGLWNGPVDAQSGKFVYVPIPERQPLHAGMERPYSVLAPALTQFGTSLPTRFGTRHMHLDPDFEHLTYGDTRERAKQLRDYLGVDDLIVFYAGLQDTRGNGRLVYAIIGVLVVKDLILATHITARDVNAHSRRILKSDAPDLVVFGRPGVSGRLERCLSIGEWRNRAYRVRRDVLEEWGGLSVKDGYLQRSARLPRFNDALRFQRWFENANPILLQSNN